MPLYIAAKHTLSKLTESHSLIASVNSDELHVVTTVMAQCLLFCGTPRTVEQHIHHILLTYRTLGEATVKHAVATLIRIRLIVVAHESHHQSQDQGIAAAVVITANRPAQCLRAVKQICGSLEGTGITDIVVVDGSSCRGYEKDLYTGLQTLSRAGGVPIRYVGCEQRRRLLEVLCARGCERNHAAFAISGAERFFDAGASRNVAQLLLHGSIYLTLDDDISLKPKHVESGINRIHIVGHSRPRLLRVGADALRASKEFLRECKVEAVLKSASRLLGWVTEDKCQYIEITNACVHQLEALRRGTMYVPVVQCGSVGDSGMHSADLLCFLDASLRAQLIASETDRIDSMRTRNMLNVSTGSVATHDWSFMAMAAVVDNRYPLPPAPPLHRNEDGIFGRLVTAASTNASIGHIPYAVEHESQETRAYGDSIPLRASDYILAAITEAAIPEMRDASSFYKAIGRRIQQMFQEDVNGVLRSVATRAYASKGANLDAMKRFPQSSCAWAKFVAEKESHLIEMASTRDLAIPYEYEAWRSKSGASCSEAREAFSSFMVSFGGLTAIWREVMQMASECVEYRAIALNCNNQEFTY